MSPRALVVAGGVTVLLLVLMLAGGRVGPLELGFLVVVFSVILVLVGGPGEVRRFETSASPQEVINAAITVVGTHRRWATLAHTEGAVTFGYHRPPSKLIAFLLLLCFIVPGIVYLVLAGKRESLSVSATEQAGRTAVQATSNGWRGRAAGRELEKQLAVIVQPTSGGVAVADPASSSETP
jgi:hypothetical protein